MKQQLTPRLTRLALAVLLGILATPQVLLAKPVTSTGMAGPYSVTLKVLPAEAFTGPNAEMVRDAGARANLIKGPEQPNHHLVVFIRQDGKPVEHARVSIRYRETSPAHLIWMQLPIVRMHVAGKSLATTHYGNNVKLADGSYEIQVTVNGSAPTVFHVTISG